MVIPIGGFSSEGTRQEASNSKSSSFERLVDSCRVGGGSSRLYKRAQLFSASLDREPVPVTMIFPLSASRGVRRSGSGDIRISPYNRGSCNARSPSSPPTVVGYELVWNDVLKYRFSITSVASVFALKR